MAYFGIFNPYSLFPFLKETETDLAAAVLRYKGVVLDSIIEDRLLAQVAQGTEDQKLVEQLNGYKQRLGQLLLQTSKNSPQNIRALVHQLEGEVEQIEGKLARHAAGLGRARRALGVTVEQVQAALPQDTPLVE